MQLSRSVASNLVPIDPGRLRPGRRFEAVEELELEPSAVFAARGLPHAHAGIQVIRELAGPIGVPDYVAVVGPPERLTWRLRSSVPPLLNQIDAGIVAVASTGRPHTAQHLARRLGWSLETVARRLPLLVRSGALLEDPPGRYIAHADVQPIGRLYALEAKIRDWRRAVRQARKYRLWCDNYIIVMGSLSTSTLANAQAIVSEDGGGLVVGMQWVTRPGRSRLSAARRLWGSEHVVAALQKPRATSPP